ncbi:MAG: aminotransferase class III-fold pyridoxal phosphate-dependent enzyme [Acidimicrobiales bacterium]|nr:aminotransferase class III-fold pyridoxal phosphate-dependent enzyme [Acidimicrobiales bacterium]
MTTEQAAAWGASGDHSPLMNNYGSPPRLFVKGAGAELWDAEGNRHLDFLCGLAVTSLGHADPDVAAAIAAQASTLIHTSNLFANEHQAPVAERVSALIDAGPGQVLFQNSGAEAVEAAIKLSRKYQGRGRHVVISAMRSFHGRTLAALAATGQPEKHEPFQPLPEGFHHVAWNDLGELERALSPEVGAILLEPVQGEGGVNPADASYLQGVRSLCDERGILLIMDEIQTGFARTGEWFGFQHAGIRPDIVTLAKGIANGMPVGGIWARDEVAAAFGPGDHGSTFAGQALALAAARATLDRYAAMDAPAVVRERGAALTAALTALDGVDHVRGAGLLLGIELTDDARAGRTGPEIARACLDEGLVLNGITPTALRVAPPFIITDEQIAEAVSIIAGVLDAKEAA